MPSYELIYFNTCGRGETSRMLFALADQEFKDTRVGGESWQAIKADTPFQQLPILKVDDTSIAQSRTIARFLGRTFGFAGKTELDQARVDMVVEQLADITQKIMCIFGESDEAKKDEIRRVFQDETLVNEFPKLEKLVSPSGFFVGEEITYGDVEFFSFCENMTGLKINFPDDCPKLDALRAKVAANPKIAAWIAKRP